MSLNRAAYTFETNGMRVDINFRVEPFVRVGKKEESAPITYCAISVTNADGKVENYFSGTICNPHDKYDYNKGCFIAFKRVLQLRWDDKFWKEPDYMWKRYHKRWAHFLHALMDDKVIKDVNDLL